MRRVWPVFACLIAGPAFAQEPKTPAVPDLRELVAKPQSELHGVVQRFEADRGNLTRAYSVPGSPVRSSRLRQFYGQWRDAVGTLDSAKFTADAQAEYSKLKETIERELGAVEQDWRTQIDLAPLLPFEEVIIDLEEARRRIEDVKPAEAAGRVNGVKKQVEEARKLVEADAKLSKGRIGRAAAMTRSLRGALKSWFNYYNGYDPLFTWWLAEPYKDADAALQSYAAFLTAKADGAKYESPTDLKLPLSPPEDSEVPDLAKLIAQRPSEMRPVLQRYQADRGGMGRMSATNLPLPTPPRSAERIAQLTRFHEDWLAELQKLSFDKLDRDDRIDYLLLKNLQQRELGRLKAQAKTHEDVARLLPFEAPIKELDAQRKKNEAASADRAAAALQILGQLVADARQRAAKASPTTAAAAVASVIELRLSLKEWAEFTKAPAEAAKAVDSALQEYTAQLRGRANPKDDSGIEGRPIGREALLAELAGELIPYSPEELMDIAEKEYAWCEAEMKKASRQMGFGDDWKKAVEKVKTLHVEPGQQPALIRDLAREAIEYVKQHDLVTVPPLCAETWRMEMMSPARQLLNPFFTGGEVITVSYPTNTMSHDAKLQTMRGNNIHFSRATVQHELIPGHALQQFMTPRYNPQRGLFTTPFWTEGWALYWEFVLYDRGFPKSAEDRVGFLFWRMHRCARIVFSLGFHLGTMSPGQCVDYLVARVGHERDNAAAEVRRSFVGSYGPLYQAAYMLGGLQIRSLREELVESGKMTERDFHDAILRENRIPIALVRASLKGGKLTRELPTTWLFYSPPRATSGAVP
ncbi:MAG: DUF885 family protein [Gemmataceae bacterium]